MYIISTLYLPKVIRKLCQMLPGMREKNKNKPGLNVTGFQSMNAIFFSRQDPQ